MPQILIPVDLVTCMAPIIAEPGDRLMVLNGICLGVHTGKAKPPNGELKLLPPPPAQAKATKYLSRSKMNVGTQERITIILKVLADKGPLHFRDIRAITGLPRTEFNTVVTHLDRKHLLTKPRKRGTGHQRLYQLKDPT